LCQCEASKRTVQKNAWETETFVKKSWEEKTRFEKVFRLKTFSKRVSFFSWMRSSLSF
jgi:hypothetical protein